MSEQQLHDYFGGLLDEVSLPLLVQDASSYVGRSMSRRFWRARWASSSTVVFATIGGMVFLHEKVGPGRLIGSVVVALGVALVVARLTTPVID